MADTSVLVLQHCK